MHTPGAGQPGQCIYSQQDWTAVGVAALAARGHMGCIQARLRGKKNDVNVSSSPIGKATR